MREIAVVFGEPVVDVDGEPVASATGCAVCLARICGLLTMRLDREAGQRIGQPLGLLDTLLGQFGIRALPWFAAERQRMPDQ